MSGTEVLFYAWVITMCVAMPFTSRVTDAIYRPRVDYVSAWDWLAMWFFNLFAALLWPLALTIGRWHVRRHLNEGKT